MNHYDKRSNFMENSLKGAIAGAVGVWAMDRLDWFMFRNENPAARLRTQTVRPDGLDPAHHVANQLANKFGKELSPPQPHPAGVAIHYALGIGPGALYGALRENLPVHSKEQEKLYALGFGLSLFLLQDEAINTITGSAARPRDYPWQAHVRGLLSHLAFGFVANAVLNLLGAPRPLPRGASSSLPEKPDSEPAPMMMPSAQATEPRAVFH